MLQTKKSLKETITSAPIPMPIPNKKSQNNIHYELKQNFFNPDKLSPPNSWNSRLLDRFYQFEKRILRD